MKFVNQNPQLMPRYAANFHNWLTNRVMRWLKETGIGLRGHTFKIHQQRYKTRRRQYAFSSPVLEQTAIGDCERFIREDIQVATGCTVAVPLPRSSPLTRPPILPPDFVPPLCYYCNYSWSSIEVFTAHLTNKRDLI